MLCQTLKYSARDEIGRCRKRSLMKKEELANRKTGKGKQVLMRVLRIATIVAISLIIGLSVYIFNAKRLMGNELPMPFGFGLSVVLTGSMEPALNVNDLVIVVPADKYVPNDDVIVFQDGSSLVIHRLVELNGETAVTKGDANNTTDEPINISQIKGKMAGRIPGVGAFVRFLQSPPGIILVLALAVFLFVISGRKEKEKATDETDEIRRQILELRRQMEEQEWTVESTGEGTTGDTVVTYVEMVFDDASGDDAVDK